MEQQIAAIQAKLDQINARLLGFRTVLIILGGIAVGIHLTAVDPQHLEISWWARDAVAVPLAMGCGWLIGKLIT